MALKRSSLPSILFDISNRYRRDISLGISDFVKNKKEDDVFNKSEDKLRLERIGFNEEYFSDRI